MIYLDHAATTPVAPEVLEAMLPYFTSEFANPSSVYSVGRQAAADLALARQVFAENLLVDPDEILFTASGTESCNLAIKGIAKGSGKKHIITSKIEHSAVLRTCQYLEQYEGFKVDYLDVDELGIVDLNQLKSLITNDTALVSVMYVNNEIGTIQPIVEIAAICQHYKVPFHTDACQGAGYLPLDINSIPVDALTLNAQKIYGPKGVGCLYLKSGTPFVQQTHGGEQETGLRPGTENMPAIIGFAKAFQLILDSASTESIRIKSLRDQLLASLLTIDGIEVNGSQEHRIANNINISVDGIEGESAVIRLDQKGIMLATGSACSSKMVEPSHVLLALGKNKNQAHSSLRITLGKSNTAEQIPYIFDSFKQVVSDLRAFSF